MWPSLGVTFLESHDTGSTQGHWPFPREKLTEGFAYILTHPGVVTHADLNFDFPLLQPVVFYGYFYDFGLRDIITELIEARTRARIHCRSPVKIYHANNDGYVAQVGDTIVMKIGLWTVESFQGSWVGWEQAVVRGCRIRLPIVDETVTSIP